MHRGDLIDQAIVTEDFDRASNMIRQANEDAWRSHREQTGTEPTRKVVVVDLYRHNVPIDSKQPWLVRTGTSNPVYTR